ncbi:Activating signal cointegrator 1 [Stylophora pistillata]|uniref:Activating signal cointegrator 1 n=1 Tax=Stylophora pistillata TaxID=50429 RepID=A0A2B4SY19_STYPI|nr:Activating signal cointegrator 1 [Stylophora pistillata]
MQVVLFRTPKNAQEGSGPCFFCGALVCTKEEQEILARKSKKSHKLHEKLLKQGIEHDSGSKLGEGLQKAIAHKNRLIEYDKSGVRRTKVIDDECDYFASDTNKWLSKKERDALKKKEDELREKRYGSHRKMKVTLDFAGRKVVDESEPEVNFDPDSAVLAPGYYNVDKNPKPQRVANLNCPNISSLKFVSSEKGGEKERNYKDVAEKKRSKEVLRIQDKEFQEMSDTGACLSMHQPWASLLVLGIKRVEGRSWYSAHRGRLWIAAAAKQPTQQEITAVEEVYKTLYGSENVVFPQQYPVSCLLGCIDLVECLAQEDYKEQFSEGESESPYVFICENPQQLALKFPVKGQHKIWKLDPAIHKAAKGGLRKAA